LSHYFDVIEKTELPVVEGELTHHSPGCYSAVGSIKRDLAATERNLLKAEKILLEAPGPDGDADRARLDAAWNRYLFNYFHDIYPGTSIRAAYEQEVRDLTGAANLAATDILEKLRRNRQKRLPDRRRRIALESPAPPGARGDELRHLAGSE